MAAVLRWLSHPVTLVAVVVLLVNDHLLKAAYPGPVTGKLSDVAGLVVAPALLAVAVSAVVRRLPGNAAAAGSLALTGVAFAAVKVLEPVAGVASGAWTLVAGPSVVLPDPTDLVALPALGLAWWVWSRVRRQTAPAPPGRPGVLVGLPLAALAVAASAAPSHPHAIAVTVSQGRLMVGEGNAYGTGGRTPTSWRVSDDAGLTWRSLTGPAPPAATATVRQQACVPGEPRHCYRTVPGHLRVEETSDGGTAWAVSWEVPDDRRRLLARGYDEVGDVDSDLSSNALAVLGVPGGHVVVVANGRDGYARRDVTGDWQRIGFGTTMFGGSAYPDPPAPLPPDPVSVLRAELLFALLAGLLTVGLGGWQAMRWSMPSVVLAATFVVGAGVMVFSALALLRPSEVLDAELLDVAGLGSAFLDVASLAVGFIVAAAGAWGTLGAAAGRRALTGRSVLLLGALGVLTAAASYTAFLGWVRDWYPYRPAVLMALAASTAGIATAGWLGHRLGHRPGPAAPGATDWPDDDERPRT